MLHAGEFDDQLRTHWQFRLLGAGCCGWFTANWDSLDGTLDPLALVAALTISFVAIGEASSSAPCVTTKMPTTALNLVCTPGLK